MPVKPSNENADAYLRFRPYLDSTHEKTVLEYFFHKSTKRVTSESDTAGKMGPTCCPTIRSTGLNPHIGVPVKYKAPTFR